MRRPRRAVTLVELLVTLVVLGVIASVTTLGVRRIERPVLDDPATTVAESLRAAIAEGRSITLVLSVHGAPVLATVIPDGSVIADSALHIDPLTARRTNAR
ncbi:MAG: hypothetical protein JWM41_4769 [Gemmatimonadetes bacterium]|nr:hypothetical protein [Gemmatimonadota bacterium]